MSFSGAAAIAKSSDSSERAVGVHRDADRSVRHEGFLNSLRLPYLLVAVHCSSTTWLSCPRLEHCHEVHFRGRHEEISAGRGGTGGVDGRCAGYWNETPPPTLTRLSRRLLVGTSLEGPVMGPRSMAAHDPSTTFGKTVAPSEKGVRAALGEGNSAGLIGTAVRFRDETQASFKGEFERHVVRSAHVRNFAPDQKVK